MNDTAGAFLRTIFSDIYKYLQLFIKVSSVHKDGVHDHMNDSKYSWF